MRAGKRMYLLARAHATCRPFRFSSLCLLLQLDVTDTGWQHSASWQDFILTNIFFAFTLSLLGRCQVLTIASMRMTVFWGAEPCSLAEIDRRFATMMDFKNVRRFLRDYTVHPLRYNFLACDVRCCEVTVA
jgi:hypothetical protein